MIDLRTSYAGLSLDNPIIVSSSGLTDTPEKVRRLAGNGPGAIVLKSLFEEQILAESGMLTEENAYPEALDYILFYSKSHAIGEYLNLVEQSKKTISQPVIASINCVSGSEWTGFARQIETAGADALELNMFILPVDYDEPERMEQNYYDILQKVMVGIRIPVIAKISPYFSNLNHLVHRFYAMGVKAVVLFNRLYEPDIDINSLRMTSAGVFSTSADLRQTLRWISLVSDSNRKMDLSASTGVHDAAAVIKLLLAGATTVQVCSVLYRNGPEYIRVLLAGLEKWMIGRNFKSLGDFRGSMSYRNHDDPGTWERTQFMRYFSEGQ